MKRGMNFIEKKKEKLNVEKNMNEEIENAIKEQLIYKKDDDSKMNDN